MHTIAPRKSSHEWDFGRVTTTVNVTGTDIPEDIGHVIDHAEMLCGVGLLSLGCQIRMLRPDEPIMETDLVTDTIEAKIGDMTIHYEVALAVDFQLTDDTRSQATTLLRGVTMAFNAAVIQELWDRTMTDVSDVQRTLRGDPRRSIIDQLNGIPGVRIIGANDLGDLGHFLGDHFGSHSGFEDLVGANGQSG